jgi:hypothetical protein
VLIDTNKVSIVWNPDTGKLAKIEKPGEVVDGLYMNRRGDVTGEVSYREGNQRPIGVFLFSGGVFHELDQQSWHIAGIRDDGVVFAVADSGLGELHTLDLLGGWKGFAGYAAIFIALIVGLGMFAMLRRRSVAR